MSCASCSDCGCHNPIFGKKIAINSFVRRQTPESKFTHWTISDEGLLRRTHEAAELGNIKSSYRPDVFSVTLETKPGEFFTGVKVLKEGDKLEGTYVARVPGETPRKEIYLASGDKSECALVDIILYSHSALAENNDAETNADFEIVSVNGRISVENQPIMPMTLMHNHFGSDGGTSTGMSPEEFEKALRESFLYWKDKAMIG